MDMHIYSMQHKKNNACLNSNNMTFVSFIGVCKHRTVKIRVSVKVNKLLLFKKVFK